jgi:hypothetical protein
VNLDIYEWLHLVIKIEIIKNRSMTKKLPFPAWSWQHSAIRRQFNLENLTTNSTLKQSKSIEISKDLVLILQIYNIYETKGREESPAFLEKKEGRRTYQGWYKAFIITIGAIVLDYDKASPSLQWDHDRGARTTSSFSGTALGGGGMWDFFLRRDHNSRALQDRDFLFL